MPYPRFEKLGEEKKQLIMSTALDEFGKRNFTQASLNKISKKAGLSAGALYYYFENKEDLFSTTIQHAFQNFTNYVGDIRERFRGGDYWEEIEQLALTRLELSLEHPETMEILDKLLETESSEESAQIERQFKDQAQNFIRTIFNIGIELGEVRKDLPESFLFKVHLNLAFLINQWMASNRDHFDQYSPQSKDVQEFVNKAIGMIRLALQPTA
jgi:TetR/AcrR family transcriptional regulator